VLVYKSLRQLLQQRLRLLQVARVETLGEPPGKPEQAVRERMLARLGIVARLPRRSEALLCTFSFNKRPTLNSSSNTFVTCNSSLPS
jgi:hypothetical protein